MTAEHNRNRKEDAFMPLRDGGSKSYPPCRLLGFLFSLVSYMSARPACISFFNHTEHTVVLV